MGSEPHVTCTLMTFVHRLEFVEQSVQCFSAQTWPNRDLLVLVDDCDEASTKPLQELLARLAPGRWRLVHFPERLNIGPKRNLALREAKGDLLCQWDDDDLYHPTRIASQVELLEREGAAACYVADVLHLFEDERSLYSCSWRRAPQGGHPATGLFRAGLAARYPESGEEAMRGEDTAYSMAIRREGKVVSLMEAAWLYIYRYNGQNTMAREHHRYLVDTMGISRSLLLRREADLRSRLAEFPQLRGKFDVHGNNGVAFTVESST